jgi:hypothetical protein
VKIDVYDKDGDSADEYVDFLKQDINVRPSLNEHSAWKQTFVVRDRVT